MFFLMMIVNMATMLLTLRYLNALLNEPLNAEGERRLEGVPTDAMTLINSGGPAVRVMKMLYTREYARFGSEAVVRAGDPARIAQFIALPVTLIAMFRL